MSDNSDVPPAPDFRLYQFDDCRHLADLLTRALFDGPVADYLVPDVGRRMEVYRAYFSIIAEYALTHGVVYGTPDFTGAAVWIDALQGIKPIDDFHARLVRDCGEYAEGLIALDHLFARLHPHKPHWYLMFLAVRPGRQNKGLGSALLHHHHQALDAHGLSAYLEASNLDNRRLYERHGYHDLFDPEPLPGGPLLYPMWRQPQQPQQP